MAQHSTTYSPTDVARRLGGGLLSFPVTHFDPGDLSFDRSSYIDHVSHLAGAGAVGLFAAGGTGEFFSLTVEEVEEVVSAAVAGASGQVPVIAPAGYGTATAIELARRAERAGAAGILLFPPYLMAASQAGLTAHVRAVCAATELGVILYSRSNAVYSDATVAGLAEACPNLVGFKDGVGDVEMMTRIATRLGDRLTYVGGLPTAEMFARPYLEMGVTTYSSALYNFIPEFALDFYDAVRKHDNERTDRYLREFVMPYCTLRGRGAGYAISIIKAGMRVVGRPAGPVRPPLTDLSEAEVDELAGLVERVR